MAKSYLRWDPRGESEKFHPFVLVKNVTRSLPADRIDPWDTDTDVPFEQSQLMAQEFHKSGVAFQFHQIAKTEHGLAGGNREEIEAAQRKAFEFIRLHLEQP